MLLEHELKHQPVVFLDKRLEYPKYWYQKFLEKQPYNSAVHFNGGSSEQQKVTRMLNKTQHTRLSVGPYL